MTDTHGSFYSPTSDNVTASDNIAASVNVQDPPPTFPQRSIDPEGNTVWKNALGFLDRPETDGPAKISKGGDRYYYKNGVLEAINGPAIVYSNGTQHYYIAGRLHRIGDQPASILSDGRKEWWYRGQRHRMSGPAILYPDGFAEYWIDGARFLDKKSFEDQVGKIKSEAAKQAIEEKGPPVKTTAALTTNQSETLKDLIRKFDLLQTTKVFSDPSTFYTRNAQDVVSDLMAVYDSTQLNRNRPALFGGLRFSDADLTSFVKLNFWPSLKEQIQSVVAAPITNPKAEVLYSPPAQLKDLRETINNISAKLTAQSDALDQATKKLSELKPSATTQPQPPPLENSKLYGEISAYVRNAFKTVSPSRIENTIDIIYDLVREGIIQEKDGYQGWATFFTWATDTTVNDTLALIDGIKSLRQTHSPETQQVYFAAFEFPEASLNTLLPRINSFVPSAKIDKTKIWDWHVRDLRILQDLLKRHDSFANQPSFQQYVLNPLIRAAISTLAVKTYPCSLEKSNAFQKKLAKEAGALPPSSFWTHELPNNWTIHPVPAKAASTLHQQQLDQQQLTLPKPALSPAIKTLKALAALPKKTTEATAKPALIEDLLITKPTIVNDTLAMLKRTMPDLIKGNPAFEKDGITFLSLPNANGQYVSFSNSEPIIHRVSKVESLITDGTFKEEDLEAWGKNGIGTDVVDGWKNYSHKEFWMVGEPIERKIAPNPPKQPEQSHFKSELTQAGYRVAGTQLTSSLQSLMVKAMPSDKAEGLKSFLKSEFGNAFVSMLAGMALTYSMPEKEMAQKLAEECRVNGLATFGNAAIDGLMSSIGNVVSNALSQVPEEEVSIETKEDEIVQEESLLLEEDPLDNADLELSSEDTQTQGSI